MSCELWLWVVGDQEKKTTFEWIRHKTERNQMALVSNTVNTRWQGNMLRVPCSMVRADSSWIIL